MLSRLKKIQGWIGIVIVVCLVIGISDAILGLYKNWTGQIVPQLPTRHMRFREWPPGLVTHITPADFTDINHVDSLVNKPYVLRVDENGFIVPSRIHAGPAKTLVFLGGSTTECLFMNEQKRFPYVVGRLLEKQLGEPVNSFNGGRSGNTTFSSVVSLLGKVIPMHPNAVVLMENINDLTVLLFEKSYWNDNPSRSVLLTTPPETANVWLYDVLKGLKNLLVKHFYDEAWSLVHWLRDQRDEFAAVRRQFLIDEQIIANVSEAYRRNLELFIYLCRLYHIEPVLMTQQNRLTETPDPLIVKSFTNYESLGIKYTQYRRLYNALLDMVRTAGKEHGVTVIDLASRIPPTPEYLYDSVHLTERGSVMAADMIAADLKKSVFTHH
jgi:lysophospholipase L1-like esterase